MRRLGLCTLAVGLVAGASIEAFADPTTQGNRAAAPMATASVSPSSAPASASSSPSAEPALDVYGGTPAVKGRKTGWFHTQRIGGRWWLVDPDGNGFLVKGTTTLGFYPDPNDRFWRNPSPQREAYRTILLAKYPTHDQWEKAQIARLKDWGFNTLVDRLDTERAERLQIPYAFIAGVGGWRSGVFKDVFADAFTKRVDEVVKNNIKPHSGDHWLIGYYSDNELPWSVVWGGGMLDQYLSLPPSSAGLTRAVGFLRGRYRSIAEFNRVWGTEIRSFEALLAGNAFAPGAGLDRRRVARDREDFLRQIAQRYFSAVYHAFKRADPHHLVMGTRFLTGDVPLAVADGMRGNVDVVSANAYLLRSLPGGFFGEFTRRANAPLMVSEFGYSAFDSGMEMDHTGAIPRVVETQAQRAERYAWFVRCAATQPFMVGTAWWWTVDGFTSHDRGNFGLVNWRDEPYKALVDGARAAHRELYGLAASGHSSCEEPTSTTYSVRRVAPLTFDGRAATAPTLDIHFDASTRYEGYGFAKSGLGADAALVRDDQSLFVLVRVHDTTAQIETRAERDANKHSPWESDGVELRFGWTQALAYFDGRTPTIDWVPSDPMPGVRVAGERLADGYFVELEVPLADLSGVIDHGNLPFAIGVNDGTGTHRLRQLQYPASFEWIYQETYARGVLDTH